MKRQPQERFKELSDEEYAALVVAIEFALGNHNRECSGCEVSEIWVRLYKEMYRQIDDPEVKLLEIEADEFIRKVSRYGGAC